MKKFILRFSFMFLFLCIVFGIGIELFLYKLDKEANTYSYKISKVNELTDTYYLCLGLLKENPSLSRVEDCEYIKDMLSSEINSLDKDFPFISIYQSLEKAKSISGK